MFPRLDVVRNFSIGPFVGTCQILDFFIFQRENGEKAGRIGEFRKEIGKGAGNMQPIRDDYAERIYAGWLGKIIGVRHGSNLEGWTHDQIRRLLKTGMADIVEAGLSVIIPPSRHCCIRGRR